VYVHLKRQNMDGRTRTQLNLFSRFKILEELQLPYLVSIMILEDITDAEAQHAARQAVEFVKCASVGEVKMLNNPKGDRIAKCEISSEINSKHVLLGGSSPFGLLKDRQQFGHHFSEAYTQFMPDALNVIVAASQWSSDFEDFSAALFGQGGSSSGFWGSNEHCHSKCAVWFQFELVRDAVGFKVVYRDGGSIELKNRLKQLFPETQNA
jgi:hypothetical protein